jgi:alpha-galactosidase
MLTKNPEIAYVKWDCNRFITQPGSTYLKADEQQNLWIDYTWALYDMMERVSKAHPKVQLMLCSGGGGRVDFGALRFFDSFWPSDNTDPLERVRMQYGYSMLFPAAATSDHVTRMNNRPMKFCCDVAMSGALGLDMDLSKLSAADLKAAAAGVAVYKQIRDVVLFGDLYRFEAPGKGPRTSLMYLSADGARAIVFAYQTASGAAKPLALTGLAAGRRYKVRELNLPENGKSQIAQDGQTLTAAELMGKGLDLALRGQCESAVVELMAVP